MLRSAQPGAGVDGRNRSGFKQHRSSARRVFVQRIVNPVVVMVVHVIANQPPQMSFVQGDDMIKDLAAAASDPTLRAIRALV